MSVVYMLKLEQEPSSYHEKFTRLTEGINLKIQDWIVQKISLSAKVLDVGCGPGILLKKIAMKGAEAFGIDQNIEMIAETMKIREVCPDLKIFTDQKDALSIPPIDEGYDTITSTFMLSELRYFERLGFLYQVWDRLKPGGSLILAEEFIPNSIAQIPFYVKRWYYSRKISRTNRRVTQPLSNLEEICKKIGFITIDKKSWKMGTFRVYQFQKPSDIIQPSIYFPKEKPWKGLKKVFGWIRCVCTGQIDHTSVEPGIYKVGTPNSDSPIIVTANYLLTYNRVMGDLQGLDAWVLCVDSDGVNVWCAARGNNFGNQQLSEAVKYSNINQLTQKKIAILPQLSAGGVSLPTLPKDLGLSFKYGPVWSKDIKEYLKKNAMKKSKPQSIVKFTVDKRIEAGISHVTFLFRSFLLIPTLLLLILSAIFQWNSVYSWLFYIWLIILTTNMVFALIFPVFDPIKVFYKKGVVYAFVFTSGFFFASYYADFPSNIFIKIGISLLVYWISFFSVMSFSGYTMETSASNIKKEYPIFLKIHKPIFTLGAILILIGLLVDYNLILWR